MTITPTEARKMTSERRRYLKGLEDDIDHALRHSFGEGGSKMLMEVPRGFDDGVLRELRRKYGEAGWNIRYEADQRDGDYLKFTAKRERK